jgi:hypothetical protein
MNVKLVGTVRSVGEPLVAPLSGRRCVAWRVAVQQEMELGERDHWQTIRTVNRASDFLLADAGHTARVDAAGAQLDLVSDSNALTGTFDNPTPAEAEFFAANPVSTDALLGFQRNLRYIEVILEEGATVAAVGVAAAEFDPSGGSAGSGYRDPAQRIVLSSTDPKRPVLIGDDPAYCRESTAPVVEPVRVRVAERSTGLQAEAARKAAEVIANERAEREEAELLRANRARTRGE